MIHLIIGGVLTAGLLLFINHARTRSLQISWWQWVLILTEFLYVVFVLEVLVSFLEEGAVKGALVLGTILGFVGLAAAFLLSRLILNPKNRKRK